MIMYDNDYFKRVAKILVYPYRAGNEKSQNSRN